jgi:OOP family OmpA-OmpF porin
MLSEKRAKAAADRLIEQGVDASRVTSVGYGETKPIADNSTREGRQANRRIVAVLEAEETASE